MTILKTRVITFLFVILALLSLIIISLSAQPLGKTENTVPVDIASYVKETYHLEVIQSTQIFLQQIQKSIIQKGACWTAAETSVFNHFLQTEFLPLGCIQEPTPDDPVPFALATTSMTVPDSWDWRNVNGKNWMTPIRNQLSCGSCVAFGTLGAVEAVLQIELNRTIEHDLSESHLFYCGGGSCSSGWMISNAVRFIKDIGVPDEDCFPYIPRDTDCEESCKDGDHRSIKAREGRRVGGFPSSNETYLQQALITYGPLITSFTVYQDFSSYHSGVYEHVTGNVRGGHAVTIVGYDNTWGEEDEGYWICKNSWGSGWGESGYFRIKYGECDIGTTFNTYYISDLYGGICDYYYPFPPSNPTPKDSSVNNEGPLLLTWGGGDPNLENTVTYDIYFGTEKDPAYLTSIGPYQARVKFLQFSPPALENNRYYYWKVIATDDEGLQQEGPLWQFSTLDTNPPVLNIECPLPGYIYSSHGDVQQKIPDFLPTIILGDISINGSAPDTGSGIETIKIFLNGRLKSSTSEETFVWEWNRISFRRHHLEIVATDRSGNTMQHEQYIWKLF